MNVVSVQPRSFRYSRLFAWGFVILVSLLVVAIVVLFREDSASCVEPGPEQFVSGEPCLIQPGMNQELIGLHVPWAIGAPAINRDGKLTERNPEYPNFPFDTVRLWDTRTAWLNLESEQDQWDFSNLDSHIDQATLPLERYLETL
jgi:hypothetical protein